MRILSIETSCDETSIAIAEFSGKKPAPKVRVLSHIVLSQIPLHKKFGGVVPNLARREHEHNLIPILLKSLNEARLGNSKFQSPNPKQISNSKIQKIKQILEREPELLKQFIKKVFPLKSPPINAIAVTYGPGLAPALWVGVNFARALSFLWNKPLIPVNHMAGHVYSALLQERRISNFSAKGGFASGGRLPIFKHNNLKPKTYNLQTIKFPALALLVSGGHTELVFMRGHPNRGDASNGADGKFKIIGETLDDAAGEAFDKVARILGLSYPGGPEISREVDKLQTIHPPKFSLKIWGGKNYKLQTKLPRPMINTKDYNFSFSGLKTAVLYLVRDLTKKYPLKKIRPVIAKEFQDAAVEVLVKKTIRAAKEYKVKTILLGGGVAANQLLRKKLVEAIDSQLPTTNYQLPTPSLTGDNALMIAVATYFTGKKIAWRKLQADANLRLD